MVRFGIIGPGGIARRFARVLVASSCGKLVAVASGTSHERAQAFAAEFGGAKAHKSYEELARDPEVDAVYVALTHNFHYEAIKLCLTHGKAVLCEKPMVLTEAHAKELAALAKEKNLLLMEAMWSRCLPVFRSAREWVETGRIGDIKLVQAAFCFQVKYDPEGRLFNQALAGGALYDAGVYPIEFATGIVGENPVAVAGVSHRCPVGTDDYTAMSFRFPGGAVAALACGTLAHASKDAYVNGTTGRVIVRDFLATQKAELYNNEGKLLEIAVSDETVDGFKYELEHFCGLFESGKKESNWIPLADTIACAGVFDALNEA